MKKLTSRMVLLCSSPRSGSTFAANLIRSSPDVLFLNEVFTRKRYLLSEYCKCRFDSNVDVRRKAFEEDVLHLTKYTIPFLGNIANRWRLPKTCLFGFLKISASLSVRIGFRDLGRNPMRRLYHVNSLHEPFIRPFYESQFPKKPKMDTTLIKDVHLIRAYRPFREMYPDAKVLYLVRNPLLQIRSQRKHHGIADRERVLDGGKPAMSASRLASEIETLQAIYGDNSLIPEHFGKSFEHTFALFWRLNNDSAVKLLDSDGQDKALVIRYEDLVSDTLSSIQEILDFLELPFSKNLDRYLTVLAAYSGKQRHGRSTFRDNTEVKASNLNNIEGDQKILREVLDGSIAIQRFDYNL